MRINIDVRDDIPAEVALEAVKAVMKKGKISRGENGKMYYCWASLFDTIVGSVVVWTRQYRKNECFTVMKDKGGLS